MNDDKMLDKIKQSANSCEVPESLKPENIMDKLEDKKMPNWNKRVYQIGGVAAAAFALVIGISAMSGTLKGPQHSAEMAIEEPAVDVAADNTMVADSSQMSEEPTAITKVVEASSREFSELFKTAKDYGDIVDNFDAYEEAMRKEVVMYDEVEIAEEAPVADMAMEEAQTTDMAAPAAEAEMAAPAATADGGSGMTDFSSTNLQVEGVDEGDIVKTDGKYIYVINESDTIRIIEIDGANMKETAKVTLELNGNKEWIIEIYKDNDKLSIITQGTGGSLKEAEEDVYYIDSRTTTNLYTYDLSNPSEPKLLGKVSQDGDYNTTRKVGDYLYLFTSFYPRYMGSIARQSGENGYQDMVPYAGEEMIEPASIYLPVQPNYCSYMVISSVNLNSPDKLIDTKAILQDSSEFTVTKKNIYVRKINWETGGNDTSIAKFSFNDGQIKGESAAIVPGEITDAFAINEYKDTLRVLTTVWGYYDIENHVTVLDDKMNVIGKIEGLAKGETIYSARFMGETGYFVTYRNVDPLFAVDFSEPKNPKILSELKITGFSEYMHFYGEGKLLGVGWETDPETGERLGMKLSMFDISDPGNVTEISKMVVKNVDYFSGEYNYKALLISPEKNLIGLEGNSWSNSEKGTTGNYMIFSYEEGKGFKSLHIEPYGYDYPMFNNGNETARGLYVNDTFYIVSRRNVMAFDMTNGFKKIGELPQ